MKRLVLPALATLIAFTSVKASAYTVVSDYDDTIKITNAANTADTVLNSFFSQNTFVGVSEYYSQLATSGTQLYIVTGTPPLLKQNVADTLKKDNIKKYTLVQKELHEDVQVFKASVLESLVKQGKGPFVLIGDDTQFDPQIYASFQQKHPDQVLAIHIRRISGRGVPSHMNYFYSTYELAEAEEFWGRSTKAVSESVAIAILKNNANELLFPHFADCPASVHDVHTFTSTPRTEQIRSYLVKRCRM